MKEAVEITCASDLSNFRGRTIYKIEVFPSSRLITLESEKFEPGLVIITFTDGNKFRIEGAYGEGILIECLFGG